MRMMVVVGRWRSERKESLGRRESEEMAVEAEREWGWRGGWGWRICMIEVCRGGSEQR